MRKVLQEVAKEMNEVMGLQPAIDLRGSEEALSSGILKASEYIEPADVFTDIVYKTVTFLEDPENAEPPIPSELKQPEAEKTQYTPKITPTQSEILHRGTVEIVFDKTKKLTRSQSVLLALMETQRKPFTADRIVERSKEIYEESTGKPDNSKNGARLQWNSSLRVLLDIGMLKEHDRHHWVFLGK